MACVDVTCNAMRVHSARQSPMQRLPAKPNLSSTPTASKRRPRSTGMMFVCVRQRSFVILMKYPPVRHSVRTARAAS
eukprot:10780233-Lingulodinium_polyedra.AAC.1